MRNTANFQVKHPEVPSVETAPQRSGGWLNHLLRRVKLAFGGDNEALVVENNTLLSWRIYHDYHLLGIVDASEEHTFQLIKHGTLNVRPLEGEDVEYLVLSLNDRIHYVRIYRRRLGKDVEVYDMHHVT